MLSLCAGRMAHESALSPFAMRADLGAVGAADWEASRAFSVDGKGLRH